MSVAIGQKDQGPDLEKVKQGRDRAPDTKLGHARKASQRSLRAAVEEFCK